MLLYIQCDNHVHPRNIVVKQQEQCIAICPECFQERSKNQNGLIGVQRNSQLIQLFSVFTSYIEKKMEEWCASVKKLGSDAVFQKIANHHNVSLLRNDWMKLNEIAFEVIDSYKNLMKSNRQCVTTSLDLELMYHPQFLKDIFSMVLDSWQLSALVILGNFRNKIHEVTPSNVNFEFKVRSSLVQQIDKEKSKLVKQYEKDIVVTSKLEEKTQESSSSDQHPKSLFSNMNEIPSIPGLIDIQSDEQLIPGIYDTPLVIKKVDSFLQLKEKQESNKKIQPENITRKNKLKKSKLIDEDDFIEWKDKFISNIQELERLKKENQSLKSANHLLSNQKESINEDNQILRRKYEKLLHENKERLTSGKKQNENMDPNSQLLLHMVELEVEINDSRHDVSIMAGCINQLIRNSVISREFISKTLQNLRTVNLHI